MQAKQPSPFSNLKNSINLIILAKQGISLSQLRSKANSKGVLRIGSIFYYTLNNLKEKGLIEERIEGSNRKMLYLTKEGRELYDVWVKINEKIDPSTHLLFI